MGRMSRSYPRPPTWIRPTTDGLYDVYVKDLTTGDLTLASTSDVGVKGNGSSFEPSISADGTKVAFSSEATNLDPADTDGVLDVYVKDLTTGDLALASTSDAGVKGNGSSFEPSISADGTKVAFSSVATNLDPADTDGFADVYVKDLTTGDLALASTSDAGVKGNGSSFEPSSRPMDEGRVLLRRHQPGSGRHGYVRRRLREGTRRIATASTMFRRHRQRRGWPDRFPERPRMLLANRRLGEPRPTASCAVLGRRRQ